MSSREIADLVESRHDSVKRTIERLSESGAIVRPPLVEEQTQDELGRPRLVSVYLIGKRDSYVIVAQLSPMFTARLVDRWQELESRMPAPAELSRMQILEMAMASERERIALAEQVEAAKPAVEFVQRYADSTGTKGFREVAKLLHANENLFREFVIEEKIMYRLAGVLTAYGNHIEAGRFCVKAGTARGNGHAYNASRFTPKGVTWVAGEWAKWQLKQREEGGHA